MVWIGFISICCSKVAKEGKSCPRLLVLPRVAQNAKSCSKVAEDNLFMPNHHHYQALSPSPTSTVSFSRNARTNEHLNILQSRKREMKASVECSSLRHDGL